MVEESQAPENDEEGEEAVVMLCTVRQLAKWFPVTVASRFADRPAWFLLQDDEELVTVFEQLPEDPMQKGHVKSVMDGLRNFANERSDALQQVLGITDSLAFGFHADAPLDRVRDAFEADGFFVLESIRDGEVALLDDDLVVGPAPPA